MNFLVDDGQWEVEDSQNTLTEYLDNNTDSGNPVHVSGVQPQSFQVQVTDQIGQRFFCRNCGR